MSLIRSLISRELEVEAPGVEDGVVELSFVQSSTALGGRRCPSVANEGIQGE